MKWFEYKAEVDALTAPDRLKERLRAMQPQAEAEQPRRKPTAKWPGRVISFAAGAAACLMLTGGLRLVGLVGMRAGASYNAASSMAAVGAPQKPAAEEGMNAVADGLWELPAEDAEPESMREPQAGETNGTVDGAVKANSESTAKVGRKIIYTSTLYLESKQYEDTLAALQQALAEAGGYVQSSNSYNYGSASRHLELVLRVPAGQYRRFLAGAEGTGSLLEKQEDSQDITAEYVDVQARIASLENQRTRLTELAAKADSLYDLLEIENQLSNVQYQLESYQGRMKVYNDQVEYCTVTVYLDEVQVYTPVQQSFGQRVWHSLTNGLVYFVDDMQKFVVELVGVLPWLLLWGALGLGGWRLVKRLRRRK